jgi:hypothetical protein
LPKSTTKYFCRPPVRKNVCTFTQSYNKLVLPIHACSWFFLQCVRITFMLTVIKLHVLHLSPCSGSLSSSIGLAGCSRSLTSFGSAILCLLKCSIICLRSFAGVACCSRRCVLRLTTAVQCCLHTSTPKSSKKHRVLSQFSSDSFSSLRR